MQIEDYFNFLAEDDIRIKGTRIGIESVLDAHSPLAYRTQLVYPRPIINSLEDWRRRGGGPQKALPTPQSFIGVSRTTEQEADI